MKPEPTPSAGGEPDMWRHGASVAGNPLTWTGRVVSLDAWRNLTEWERHGPDGRAVVRLIRAMGGF